MMRHYLFGIAVLIACFCLEVSSKPSNNESTSSIQVITETPKEKERSLTYDETDTENQYTTKEILEKIKAINDALKKPSRRNQYQWNAPHQTGGEYVLDKEILEKLQQVIASGKLNSFSNNVQQQESNTINNENLYDTRYSRQLASLYAGNQLQMQQQMAVVPTPYIMSMPVLVMPSMNNMYDYGNVMNYGAKIQTKEGPMPSPFPTFQWPFASLFPILIRDPLLSIMNGGGWNNFIEYGQSADVCRKQKANEQNNREVTENQDDLEKAGNFLSSNAETKSRQKRAVKKRTVAQGSQLQDIDPAKLKKFFSVKPTTTAKPVKQEPVKKDTKTTAESDDGDLRFNFLDMFGNKYKQPTGPGFFINRLKVRRGGVAIAGPGGVATAGRGGTAIVGPGGLAYTQPGGIAVAGPAARVVALSSDADLTSIANRLQAQSTIDGSIPQLLQAIPEGKIVATGPIIYHHPNKRYASVQYIPFYGGGKGQYLEIKKDNLGRITSEKIVSEENISSENIVKNSDENLIAKVMAANLQNLRTLSTNLLKLHNLGRKTGSLGSNEKARFKTQLASLGEAASNIIKLIEEVDDVDVLFKKNATVRTKDEAEDDEDDDYIAEEGVGIDASSDEDTASFLEKGTIAEAKPVGLAVIGESGLAASRPLATAVALSGVALARPIATAVAGVDPSKLGIDFHINHAKKSSISSN